MSKVVDYEHHGVLVAVQEHLKGKHQEHCLCWQGCKRFHPEPEKMAENCPKARLLFTVCVLLNLVTPVWECEDYED